MTTDFQPGDTDVNLLQKILVQLGGTSLPGDLETGLLGKILVQMGGTPRPGDFKNVLYRKINQAAGIRPFPGDDTNKLLFRIAQFVGGNPLPGDTDNNLLRKWLGNPEAITDNIIVNRDFPKTPGFPGGEPGITIFIPDNPYWLNKWFSFWVSVTAVDDNPDGSDFVFNSHFQATTVPTSFEVTFPVPAFSPAQICLLIAEGNTEAEVLNADIDSMAEDNRENCWVFPDSFTAIPPAPVATAATGIDDDEFDANWNAASDATSYRLDVSTSPVFASFVTGFNNLNVGNVTTFNVIGLTAATTYYYRVRAVNVSGTSANSNTITVLTVPAAPVATAATSITDDGFNANWNAVTGATSYRLDVSTSNVFASFVTGFEDLNVGNVTTFAVTGLDPLTTYYYRVRAANGTGSSANSNTISLSTILTPNSFAGLQGWWKVDSFAPQADGTAIGGAGLLWEDQVGTRDGSQSTASFRPTYWNNIFGTAPAIRFAYTASFSLQMFLALSATEGGGIDLAGDFTIVAVTYVPNPIPQGDRFGGSLLGNAFTANQTALHFMEQFGVSSGLQLRISGGTPTNVSSSAYTDPRLPLMAACIRSGLNVEFRRNAATVSSHVIASANLTRINHMGAVNSTTFGTPRFGGYVGEICIYNQALSAADLNSLFTNYFQPKFSL